MTTAPLTPPDCDLQDFIFMPIEVKRLLDSETWVLGSSDERAAAMTLWLKSWHQVPAGSIPNNDKMLAHLSMCSKWTKVKGHALRGWVECSDGRLYHPVVCEKVLEAWIEKLGNRLSGAAGNSKRWGLEIDNTSTRAQMHQAISMLAALAPRSKSLRKKLVVSFTAGSFSESLSDHEDGSPPDSGRNRKGQGQGQGKRQGHRNTDTEGADNSSTDGSDHSPFAPTIAGGVGMAMKRAGVDPDTVNLGDPRLAVLLRQGAMPDEFEGLAREAIAKGIENPWPWVLKVLPERRKDAQRINLGPRPAARSGQKYAGAASAIFGDDAPEAIDV